MNPIIKRRLERAARHRQASPPVRTWSPAAGLWYCDALPVEHLEPICERVSRVQGEKFTQLVTSIRTHGLANPLITVSELPAPNLDHWHEWRYRFLYTIPAPIKVVVGHNRYAAIQLLGWRTVPVIHCGPIPETAIEDTRAVWIELDGVEEAQRLCRDGRLGLGPYSLVMEQFTPPLKGMPAGFEGSREVPVAKPALELVQELGAQRQGEQLAGAVALAAGQDELAGARVERKARPRRVNELKPALDLKRSKAKKRGRKASGRAPARHR